MTYNVDFVIHGHHEIEIEADNYEDAVDMAEEILSMQDFGALNYEVDTELYSIEDEDEILGCYEASIYDDDDNVIEEVVELYEY